MLSTGQYHKSIPKALKANLAWRQHVLEAASKSPEMQQAIIQACKSDILFFINTFVFQYDPTSTDSVRFGPFISWPFQDRLLTDCPEETGRFGLLWCVHNKQPAVWEKSREMGATWLMLIAQTWLCLFFKYFQSLDISKSGDAVDSKTKNSLFTKVEFILNHLPDWLKGHVVRQKMYIEFAQTKSEMAGEASSARSGVGGRGGFVGIDEAAEIEELHEVKTKLTSTAPFRLYVSTHLGTGNVFYDISKDSAYKKSQIHWTQHPAKNKGLYSFDTNENRVRFWEYIEARDEAVEIAGPKHAVLTDYDFDRTGKPSGGPHPGIRSPWYDKMCREIKDDRGVAMQLDINPAGSVSQFYMPMVIRELKFKHCCPPYGEYELEYDKQDGTPYGLVRKEGGKIRLWCELRNGRPPVAPYGGGTDVAQGTGTTPSCLTFANGKTGEKVLEYVDSTIDPKEFGVLAVALGRLFVDEYGNGALLVWEHHGPGTAFGLMVWDKLAYANVWFSKNEHDWKKGNTTKPGWTPSGTNKLNLHIDYRAALMDGHYLNRSERALDETLNFKHDGKGSVEHAQYVNKTDPAVSRESHGDIVTADALSYKMIKGLLVERSEKAEEPETLDVLCFQGRRNISERSRRRDEIIWR